MRHEDSSFNDTFDRRFLVGVWEIVIERRIDPGRNAPGWRLWDEPPMGSLIEFRANCTGLVWIEAKRQPFKYRKLEPDVSVFSLRLAPVGKRSFDLSSATVVLQDGRLRGLIEWADGGRSQFSSSRRVGLRSRSGPSGANAWAVAVPPWLRSDDSL